MSVLLLFPNPPANAAKSGGMAAPVPSPHLGAANLLSRRMGGPPQTGRASRNALSTRRPERVREIRALPLHREIGAVAFGVMEGVAVLIGLGIAELALIYMLF